MDYFGINRNGFVSETFLFRLKKLVKDSLFPFFCVVCGAEGELLCAVCYPKIDLSGVFACPRCGRENGSGFCCVKCKRINSLDRHIAITRFINKTPAQKLLHDFNLLGADLKAIA